MINVTLIDQAGTTHAVGAKPGETLMEVAVKNTVPGIDADCGGACACATCHVVFDDEHFSKVGAPNPTEKAMLEFADGVEDTSRLACQVSLSQDHDGLCARVVNE